MTLHRNRRELDRDAIAAMDNCDLPDEEYAEPTVVRQVAGRGAVTNPAVRFDPRAASPFDDGWATLGQDLPQDLGELPRLETTLTPDSTRSA